MPFAFAPLCTAPRRNAQKYVCRGELYADGFDRICLANSAQVCYNTLTDHLRDWYIGNTSASQAEVAGSTPVSRSIKITTPKGVVIFMDTCFDSTRQKSILPGLRFPPSAETLKTPDFRRRPTGPVGRGLWLRLLCWIPVLIGQGQKHPQGVRRIRKAARPPTAAQYILPGLRFPPAAKRSYGAKAPPAGRPVFRFSCCDLNHGKYRF